MNPTAPIPHIEDDPNKPALVYGDSRIRPLPGRMRRSDETFGERMIDGLATFAGIAIVAGLLAIALVRLVLEMAALIKYIGS